MSALTRADSTLPGNPPPARRRLGLAIGAVLLAGAGLGVVALLRSQQVTPAIPQAARGCGPPKALVAGGERLPTGCKLEALSGGAQVSLAQYAAGKPMVVNFWASWCGACVQEMPALQQVYAAGHGQVQFLGLDLLGVDGEARSGAQSFARERAVRYPLAYDNAGLLYGRISLRVLPPTTAFVRPDGTLAGFEVGQLTAPRLRQDIARYLGVAVAA